MDALILPLEVEEGFQNKTGVACCVPYAINAQQTGARE